MGGQVAKIYLYFSDFAIKPFIDPQLAPVEITIDIFQKARIDNQHLMFAFHVER